MVSLSSDQLQSYFQSLVRNFQGSYISTDLADPQDQRDHHFTCRLQLKANRVLSKEEPEDGMVERLPVLEGLRKYQRDHVLLIGKPGSGKSTSLERLLLEEAQICQNQVNFDGQIPVLLKLRSYRVSIISMIQTFLKTHDLNLTHDEIQKLLDNGNFLLSMDGLNELPDDNARQELINFRDLYKHKIPMIFTTRDISLGGTFGITKQLQMNSLTDAQMKEFIKAELHIDGEVMLRNLGDKLRKFAETPLFLWMLCQVYDPEMKQLPNNLAETFQLFTQMYDDEFKHDVFVDVKNQGWQSNLLQNLAFQMMQSYSLTDFRLEIDRNTVEDILTNYLKIEGFNEPRSQAKSWLKDLLKYHLIQAVSINKIEFRHQLIQEYYAAEFLKKRLKGITDEELKWHFLNYTKWTETLALMLGLLDDESQLQRLVKLALEIDLKLGARFAGEVKIQFQKKTVNLVSDIIDVPKLFKIDLLGMTRSEEAINELIIHLEDENKDVRRNVVRAFGKIGSKQAIPSLKKSLKDVKSVYKSAVWALQKISPEQAIPNIPKTSKKNNARKNVVKSFGNTGLESSIPYLLNALKDKDNRRFTNQFLRSVPEALSKTGSQEVLPVLIKALTDDNRCIRRGAATALGNIGNIFPEKIILLLLKALKEDHDTLVRKNAAEALGKIVSEKAILGLQKALEDEAILGLQKALNDEARKVRKNAAKALGNISSEKTILSLVEILKDPYEDVRRCVKMILIQINSEATLTALFHISKESNFKSLNNGDTFYQAYIAISTIQDKLKYYQPLPSTMTTSKIYISYAWQGDSETIAQQIEETLQKKGLTIIRDKTGGLGYKGSIKEFMDFLGRAECIILIISDKYLKSENCIYELIEIYKNGDFIDRIFPVILQDAKIFKAVDRLKYVRYWEKEVRDLQDEIKEGNITHLDGIIDDLDFYSKIRRNLGKLTKILKNINTLTPVIHTESGFEELFNAIEKKLNSDQSLE
jgi:HEAT repeat protein/ABC-type dipeptide/oligopeptide/nickel transport system ATPase component